MSGHYKLLQMLRDQGHRLTPQREMVILALHEADGHLSAEEIHQRVQQQNPYVDISTVYRTLELLREIGIVSQFQVDGHSTRFELTIRSPHHHLMCECCGTIRDLGPEELEGLKERLFKRYQFEAHLDHLVIRGLCAECAAHHHESPHHETANAHS